MAEAIKQLSLACLQQAWKKFKPVHDKIMAKGFKFTVYLGIVAFGAFMYLNYDIHGEKSELLYNATMKTGNYANKLVAVSVFSGGHIDYVRSYVNSLDAFDVREDRTALLFTMAISYVASAFGWWAASASLLPENNEYDIFEHGAVGFIYLFLMYHSIGLAFKPMEENLTKEQIKKKLDEKMSYQQMIIAGFCTTHLLFLFCELTAVLFCHTGIFMLYFVICTEIYIDDHQQKTV